MTPKEKAQELVDKMAFQICKTDAKECALIAVDEILKISEHESPLTYVYYMEVKQEIEAL